MEYLVNAKQMKACDANTINYFGIDSLVLMERAALCVTDQIISTPSYLQKSILILCGVGNNGADGLAIARLLFLKNYSVDICVLGDIKKATKEFQVQYEIIQKYKISQVTSWIADSYSLIVDAIFGIGLSRNIEGNIFDSIEQMNQTSTPKLSVDISSGVNATDGSVMGIAVKADLTITFAYKKIGQLLYPGHDYTGVLKVADIGIPMQSWLEKKPIYHAMTKNELNNLPLRKNQSNKGTYGKLLLIAGTLDMAGAAILSAKAAYTIGCGLVKIFTPKENRIILQQAIPEAILVTYDINDFSKEQLLKEMQWATVIGIGPGLGVNKLSEEIVDFVIPNSAVPLIIDADALNIISQNTDILLNPHTELILTPHLGEMSRLRKTSVSFIQKNIISVAEEFAREYNVICVLKDATSICSIPYSKTYLNLSGNPGMATAGSGDVLTGCICGLLAQGMSAEIAAPLGMYIHGLSGDDMICETGMEGLMATDIIHGIKKVMKQRDRSETL